MANLLRMALDLLRMALDLLRMGLGTKYVPKVYILKASVDLGKFPNLFRVGFKKFRVGMEKFRVGMDKFRMGLGTTGVRKVYIYIYIYIY
jgi:hypothetical protein